MSTTRHILMWLLGRGVYEVYTRPKTLQYLLAGVIVVMYYFCVGAVLGLLGWALFSLFYFYVTVMFGGASGCHPPGCQ